MICHCYQCQALTGTAFTYNWLVPRENVALHGEPKYSTFTQELGFEVKYAFCPDCSTVIIKQCETEVFKPFYLVQAGTIAKEALVKGGEPDEECWVSRKANWLKEVEGSAQRQQFD